MAHMIDCRFELGRLVITRNAASKLTERDVQKCLTLHAAGDWGELGEDDLRTNDQALAHGGRLLSSYVSEDGVKFWIITEADRSATTILLPEDY